MKNLFSKVVKKLSEKYAVIIVKKNYIRFHILNGIYVYLKLKEDFLEIGYQTQNFSFSVFDTDDDDYYIDENNLQLEDIIEVVKATVKIANVYGNYVE